MLFWLLYFIFDRKCLRKQLLNVSLGTENTATIGIYEVFPHVVQHPSVYCKLRTEVASSRRITLFASPQYLSVEALNHPPYLKDILEDVLY